MELVLLSTLANLKQEYANKSDKVEGDINQGRNSHRQEVGRLATHAKNAQDQTNGVTMRINTHALPWNSFGERYDNAMKDVREGKGYIGSGSDQAAAHLGNPALASEFDLPIPQRPGIRSLADPLYSAQRNNPVA